MAMPFRRFTPQRFTRGRNSSFRSRRGALRKPGDRRWEKSQFLLQQNVEDPAGASSSQMLAFHIASIAISLQQEGSAVPAGVALGSMTRKLLIGGIEFDWSFRNVSDDIASNSASMVETQNFHQFGLCSDELSVESGQPMTPNFIAAGWNPFLSQFPISALTASTPSTLAFDPQRPKHIHWKNTQENFNGVQSLTVSEDLQLVQTGQSVYFPRGHVSKRLRLVLDDNQGLFFYFATQNTNAYALSQNQRLFSVWACGTLFWRYQL